MELGDSCPIQLLQAICSAEKILPGPVYTEINKSGPAHSPIFSFKCELGSLTTTSSSSSIKKAKKDAAFLMIELLRQPATSESVNEEATESTTKGTEENVTSRTTKMKEILDIDSIRPVEILEALCSERKLTPGPTYEEVGMTGPSHIPVFTYTCQVQEMKVSGSSNSKKQAKKNAAKHMVDILRGLKGYDKYAVTDDLVVSENNFPNAAKSAVAPEDAVKLDTEITKRAVAKDNAEKCKVLSVTALMDKINLDSVTVHLGCPIQQLQQWCSAMKILPGPTYTEENVAGSSHCPGFTYKCRIGNLSTSSVASTKKQSKRNAAELMIQELRKYHHSVENLLNSDLEESDTTITEAANINLTNE